MKVICLNRKSETSRKFKINTTLELERGKSRIGLTRIRKVSGTKPLLRGVDL
uniref:Uncharacterized protein n=1 Tax=Helianthus annuus TaxID=4232 RepID=A0A251SJ99_HELAN